ncbi:hypothetical protein LBMAG53_28230 [Planctomycetota bacterium]|nr:hypothetical protein LBMAG53_28230 [Planctomycetota bacterium]
MPLGLSSVLRCLAASGVWSWRPLVALLALLLSSASARAASPLAGFSGEGQVLAAPLAVPAGLPTPVAASADCVAPTPPLERWAVANRLAPRSQDRSAAPSPRLGSARGPRAP